MEFKGFKKGVNLGGWLSQCCHTKEHYDSFITEDDVKKIASWGVDHVRLPIDYNLLEKEDGTPEDSGFAYIDSAVEWCRSAGLHIVLDLHKTAGFSFDKGENESGFFEDAALQERFIRLWKRISGRYAESEGMIAFELLNEVTEQKYSDTWNGIISRCVEEIHSIAPDNYILVGGYRQNSPDAVPDLEKPANDKVVFNFHCYDPMKFTHQGAYWYEGMDTSFRMKLDECETEITEDFFLERFARAVETAEKYGTALYCGEYGVIDLAEPKEILKWYKAINSAFEKLGISRSAWSYKTMDFGLSDECMDGVREELVKYL
ncbi:MAG: cellulase family glycosylhydrolase [Oscillospiraceae bacterium]|nr:cellulase family glycosylhydrolase [Oscillospiraceae bacterium]